MHQSSGLKCLARRLARYFLRSQTAEFVINQRNYLLRRFWVSLLNSVENVREVADENTLPETSSTVKHI